MAAWLCAATLFLAPRARALTPVVAYPVTITNGQALGGVFQQAVTWNPSLFSTFESADLGNIRFCADSACATPLNAWLEGCSPSACAPTASTATAWVNLQNAVPAQGVAQIYIAFMDTSVDFDANYWGESIDIAPGFDNGSLVFTYYNNGQDISNFTLANGGALGTTVMTNPLGVSTNVITLTGSGVTTNSQETVAWYNNAVSSDDMVVEGWINIGPTNNAGVYNQNCMFAYRGASASPTSLTNYIVGIGWSGTFLGIAYENGTTNTYLGTGGGTRQNGWFWSYTTLAGTAMTASVWNQPPELGGVQASTITVSNNQITTNSPYLGMANWAGSNTPSYFYQWRARRFPPAGVLPTAIVNVPPQNCQGVIVSNPNPTQATPVPFEQSLTLYPTTYATLENSNLGNVRFCADSNCTQPLFAWLEGCGAGNAGCTPASGAAQVWVKLTSSIPANGTQTIYQCFVSTSQTFDGIYWGQSTDIAAGHDNGSYVFPFYTNGQSLSGFSPVVNGGGVTTVAATNPYGTNTNLIQLSSKKISNTSTAHTVVWTSSGVLGDNMVLEGWVNRNTSNSAMLSARGANDTTLTDYLLGERFNGKAASIVYENANAGNILSSVGSNLGAGWYWTEGVISGTALSEAIYSQQPEFGGTQTATATATDASISNANTYVGMANRDNINGVSEFYEWRVRHYFPGGTGTVIDSTAPTTVTDLGAGSPSSSTVLLTWSAPSDANYNPLSGQYAIQYASYTAGVVWSTANAQVLISTSGVSPGAAQGAVVGGLLSNTTYFFYLWTQDSGLVWSAISNGATSQTLAAPVSAASGVPLSVSTSGVVAVGWTALPASPQSSACEGYVLQESSTDFNGGTIVSSSTPNGLASQLTLSGLNTGATMYFRLATLNWSASPDTVTLTPVDLQVSPSTGLIVMGLDATVAFSTVSVSSIVVTNVGNYPLTLMVSGSTATAGSPWVLAISSGIEQPVLQGEWNSTQPTPASFTTAITSAPVASGALGGAYAGGQSGKALAPGASVTMWFQFWAPKSTVAANVQEALQVLFQSVYP